MVCAVVDVDLAELALKATKAITEEVSDIVLTFTIVEARIFNAVIDVYLTVRPFVSVGANALIAGDTIDALSLVQTGTLRVLGVALGRDAVVDIEVALDALPALITDARIVGGAVDAASVETRIGRTFVEIDLTLLPAESSRTRADEVDKCVLTGPTIEARVVSAIIDIGLTCRSLKADNAVTSEPVDLVGADTAVVARVWRAIIDIDAARGPSESRSTLTGEPVHAVRTERIIEAGRRGTLVDVDFAQRTLKSDRAITREAIHPVHTASTV